MQVFQIAAATLAALALGGTLSKAEAQTRDTTTQRPTDVTLTISNDPFFSGVYHTSDTSRVCGKMDLGYPHRANSFHVEFPNNNPDLPVGGLSFDADTLPIGVTITSFQLNVNITTPTGGKPPQYVVRAKEPKYQEPGTATLTGRDGHPQDRRNRHAGG